MTQPPTPSLFTDYLTHERFSRMWLDYGPYYEFARANGFAITPQGGPGVFNSAIQLYGAMGGRPIFITRTIGRSPAVSFRAALNPSLDLGLSLRPRSLVAAVFGLFEAAEVEVGDAVFDNTFAIHGDNPDRVRAFLTPRLRTTLMPCASAPLVVDDSHVTLHYSALGASDAPEAMFASLRCVVAIANEADLARTATPPPADVAPLVAHLDAYARERNLACAFDSPPRVMGAIDDLSFWIVARRRNKNRHDLEIGLRLDQPLDFAFTLETARTGLDRWFVGEDLQLGDAEVDRAFDIRSEDPARFVALLDEPSRRTLLELGRGRHLKLESSGLHIADDARDFDPIALPAVIERAADLLKTISRAARLRASSGYR